MITVIVYNFKYTYTVVLGREHLVHGRYRSKYSGDVAIPYISNL